MPLKCDVLAPGLSWDRGMSTWPKNSRIRVRFMPRRPRIIFDYLQEWSESCLSGKR